MKAFNRKIFLTGISFVLGAFLCLVAIFYFLLNEQQRKAAELMTLQERILAVNAEKDVAEKEAAELKGQVGRSINLKNLIEASRRYYGGEEKDRRAGYLWVDPKNDTLLVTLGALNGVSAGSRLAVMDGDNPVGFVRVETPLDVISYVRPVDLSANKFEKEFYRVVLEE